MNNVVKSPAIDMCLQIIEDGKKWQSIDRLMNKYELTFPFALEHKEFGKINIVECIFSNSNIPEGCCGEGGRNNSGENTYHSVPCARCVCNKPRAAGWSGKLKNWRLASD